MKSSTNSDTGNAALPDRILVIDDEQTIAEMIAMMLRSEKYNVDIAFSGKQGIEVFKEGLHDLVLTDLKLGDVTGIDVLAQIKSLKKDTAVVIFTGYATTESAVEAIRLGANDYLTKPVRIAELLMTVRSQLNAVHMQRHIATLNNQVAQERDKLSRSVTELTLLKRLAERMMTTLSAVEGFDLILNLLVEEVSADVALIYLINAGTIRISTTKTISKTTLKNITELLNSRGSQVLKGEINCHINQFEGIKWNDDPKGTTIASSVIVPICQENKTIGLLSALSFTDADFEEKWGEFINKISQDASLFLERMRHSVERQRISTAAIVEHTQDGIIIMSPDSGEVLMNPKARGMLDVAPNAIPTIPYISDFLSLDFNEITHNLEKSTQNQELKFTNLFTEITLRDVIHYLRLTVSFLPNTDNSNRLLMVVLSDVTKEKSIEEMKTRLVANISHELRTPTAVVKEFISLLLDGIAGPMNETQQQYITIIQSNILRLARLIENLLTLARAETGGFSVNLKPTDICHTINSAVRSLTVKLARKNITLDLKLPEQVPLVYADADAVTQILTNLIENSYKYSSHNTTVKIRLKVKGARIEISVKDQGIGIPKEDQEKVFKRFQRLVDKNDPRFQEGVGLGLSVVKDLVVRHGGEIWLESEPGIGSTFTFSLLVMEEKKETQTTEVSN